MEFYTPRLYRHKAVYLNKSNTKWIEIGVAPGDVFSPVAYFCGKGQQIHIPCALETFLEKIGELLGVGPSGTAKLVLIKASNTSHDDLSIEKVNYGTGMYKVFNSSDSGRAVFTTAPTLSYLRQIGKSLKGMFNCLNAAEVKKEFDKIVLAASIQANVMETIDYGLVEAELLQHPPPDVNMEMFYETTANFRTFFYRQLRIQLKTNKN